MSPFPAMVFVRFQGQTLLVAQGDAEVCQSEICGRAARSRLRTFRCLSVRLFRHLGLMSESLPYFFDVSADFFQFDGFLPGSFVFFNHFRMFPSVGHKET